MSRAGRAGGVSAVYCRVYTSVRVAIKVRLSLGAERQLRAGERSWRDSSFLARMGRGWLEERWEREPSCVGVTNMPGAVPRTSTFAISNVTLPYTLRLANLGFVEAARREPALALGVNIHAGHVTYPAVAEAFDLDKRPIGDLLSRGIAA